MEDTTDDSGKGRATGDTGDAKTKRQRTLRESPRACVHLESGSDVVIMYGRAREAIGVEPVLALRLATESKKKYGYAPAASEYERSLGVVTRYL